MNEMLVFVVLFGAMFLFHELGHVAYAKFVGVYMRVTIFRLYHLSNKIPRSGLGLLPLGAAVETDLVKETLHQRVINCVCGTLAGLPIVAMGFFLLPGFEFAALVGLYMVGYSVDFIIVLQILGIAFKKGCEMKMKEVV